MKVLIDTIGVSRVKAGVGVYVKNLVDALLTTEHLQLFLLVHDDDPDFHFEDQQYVTVLRVPSRLRSRNIVVRLLIEQLLVPVLIRRHGIDVVHSPHYSFPLFLFARKAKRVVTIHDMTAFLMPDVHLWNKMHYYRFFMRRARNRADGLIFVSRSAEKDFQTCLGELTIPTAVVHHGKSPLFRPDADAIAIEGMRCRYKLPESYVLYIGTIEPRKNLERLIEAFARVLPQNSSMHLVIAGMMGWKQEHLLGRVRALNLEERVHFPGFVDERDKPLLLSSCVLFVYPSLYEGFGLPVLEALASGTPTITSNTASLPEVAGSAAVLVDPLSVFELADAMRLLLTSPVRREELQRLGPERAASFTWERAARDTFDFYRMVTNNKVRQTGVD